MQYTLRNIIVAIIDFVHKPFSKLIPAQTFRYLACGGGNTVLGLVLYSVVYNYVLRGNEFHVVDGFSLTARVASLFLTSCVTFPVGFLLSSYVVFPESQLHGRVQLFRYSLSYAGFIVMAYCFTKFFAYCIPLVRADVANIFVNVLTAILSYITQKLYTFKIEKEEAKEEEMTLQ